MSRKWLTGSIALSKLVTVITERKGKNGMVKGLFIPFDLNYLTVKEKAVYLNLRVGIADEPDQHGQIAMITQSVDSAIYKVASDEKKEELKKLPILGNLKDWSVSSSNSDDAAQEIGETDDLPF